jgi:hypothetical protein
MSINAAEIFAERLQPLEPFELLERPSNLPTLQNFPPSDCRLSEPLILLTKKGQEV